MGSSALGRREGGGRQGLKPESLGISEQEERKSPPRLATKQQAESMTSTGRGQKTPKATGAAGRSFG